MFKSSVVSYQERGSFGKSSYRGNTTGYIIKDFLETYHKDNKELFCDPAMGSDTSGDVARLLGVNYKGLDLYNGFNLCRDNLLHVLGSRPKTVFFHPPYHDMIHYSGNMWGTTTVNGDMSNCASVEDFLKEIQLGLINIYDSLDQNGVYGVLIGNMRRKGEYIPLTDYIRELCLGKYVDEIIKIQHNCVSDQTRYSGTSFVPIKHEKLYIFKKVSKVLISLFNIGVIKKTFINITWKNILRSVFVLLNQKELDLTTIYDFVSRSFVEKVKDKSFWKEKIRQTLQDKTLFVRTNRGVYSLV